MIRAIVNVLRKHLQEAYEGEEQWEAIIHDPFDIMAMFPDYDMLRRLAHDLVKVMKMEKCEKHIRIPDQKATIKMLREIYPGDPNDRDEEFWDGHARYLRRWLLNWNTTMRTYRERRPIEPLF